MLRQKSISHVDRKSPNFPVALILLTALSIPLRFVGAETLTVEDQPVREIQIVPNGVNPAPNWGLHKIGEQQNDGQAYTYPDTTHPVRLYLIDTAVANPGDWIGENPNLTWEGTTLIRSSTDSIVSTQFGHGTRMLSLIAGLNTGVAPGTPIKVKNYDVYPSGTTTATKLALAVEDAVAHYQDSVPRIPAVICIASSSSFVAASFALEDSIKYAVAEGITVIISAGNLGQNAASYIPSSYGTIPGVICVGASNANDQRISSSNYGTPVNLLAPGENILVKTEDSANPHALMTGTSPAAALVAGSALSELSMNGSLTPAQVEARLIASAKTGSPPVLRTTTIAAATIAYPDGPMTSAPIPLACANFPSFLVQAAGAEFDPQNGAPAAPANVLQVFHGVADDCEAPYSIALSPQNELEFTFPIDVSLLDPSDLFTLRNGYAWRIRSSRNLDFWEVPEGSISKKTAPDGTVWLTAKIPATSPSCFLRIELAETPAP